MSEKNLVLVRHATAEDKSLKKSDAERKLTDKGWREAECIADLAKTFEVPKPETVFTSGFVRAEQTLAAFKLANSIKVVRDELFAPEGNVSRARDRVMSLLAEKKDSEGSTVWVVGHNPFLDDFLAKSAPQVFSCIQHLQKSALLWLQWEAKGGVLVESEARIRTYLPKPRN